MTENEALETLAERWRELGYGDNPTEDQLRDYAEDLKSATPGDPLEEAEDDEDLTAALVLTGDLEAEPGD